jgi:hypothetical protein
MTVYQYSGTGIIYEKTPDLLGCDISDKFNSNVTTFDSTIKTFDSICIPPLQIDKVSYTYNALVSGSIFGGVSGNKITASYNLNSIFDNTEDYGSIVNDFNLSGDYGEISQSSGPTNDFNLITDIVSGISEPFGGLILSGSAITQVNYRLFFSGNGNTKVTYSPDNTSGTLFQFGSVTESFSLPATEGTGLFQINGTGLESRTYPNYNGSGTLYEFNGVARTYSPVYPRNAIPEDPGSGIGTIRINAVGGPTIPILTSSYFGQGTIFVDGICSEKFVIGNYNGSGVLTFSRSLIEIEKETDIYVGSGTLSVFGELVHPNIDYTPHYGVEENIGIGTTGIQLSGSLFEKETNSYVGSGTLTVSRSLIEIEKETDIYVGSGTLTVSGSSLEVYSVQIPKDTILYQFNGDSENYLNNSYFGSGQLTLGSASKTQFIPINFASGILRFTTYLSDNLYDTCDSVDITSDYENSAFVSFTANVPKSTQILSILGSANTSEINVYEYVGIGNLTLSDSLIEVKTDSYVGIGSLFTFSGIDEVSINSYGGNGTLFPISGSSESKSSQTPENTILINVLGTASTKLEYDYSYSGVGTAYINNSAFTSFEADYPYSGVGSITLSGELIYPDIKFIPTPKGFGLFTVLGSSPNSSSVVSELSGNKSLFAFSGGFESFSKSTYIGFGTIYISETSSITVNNPFRIPRTYVVII